MRYKIDHPHVKADFIAENDAEAIFEANRVIVANHWPKGEYVLFCKGESFSTAIAILSRTDGFTSIQIPDEIALEEV